MTTNKELADAYRLIADNDFGAMHRAYLSDRANELDPPKPTWPDGMYAIVTFEQRFDERALASYARRAGDEWVTADGRKVCDEDEVTKVEPLRVLGDDEIALDRAAFGDVTTVRAAQHVASDIDDDYSSTASAPWLAYADALATEAGDAK